MSILIKGMKMPKRCGECKFIAWKQGVGNHCAIDESITFHAVLDGFDVRYEKNGNCPLIELQPHGRLIDAWEFEVVSYKGIPDGCKDTFDDGVLWMCEKIDDAPTVIPADKDGAE